VAVAKEAAVRLADGVWRIPTAPGDMINSFALAGSDGGVTLVDAGLKFPPARRRLVAGLRAIGAAPADVRRIVITHAHPDHAGGLAALVALTGGAGVLAHERESVYLRDGRSPRTRRGSTRSFPKVAVTGEFQDGTLLPGGLRAVHTPGHSPGHTALLHEGSGVLITGDAVINLRGVRYAPGFLCTDPDRNRSSADQLGELDFEIAAFAHGPELRRDAKAAVRALALGLAR
jgi:glyoxylase-like metal-dependent hydrolase (beta-lactamase superfamily II)